MEYRRFILLMPLLLLALPLMLLMSETSDSCYDSDIALAPYVPETLALRDTIFILSDKYVSVSLKDQTATVILRDGSNHAYKISTGNAGIYEGFATPTGIFTVQSKCPLAESRQFNNAELYHWVGFYYNYGFHGLRTSGYYRHLGKRPSSHGCIRIGRDDARSLYYEVRIGTPVMVFDDEPARIFVFADLNDFNPVYDRYIIKWSDEQRSELASRISNLYTGRARTDQIGRIFMDGKTALG
ncbi:MAG: L,D-transpeptidase, partial [Chlorobi bacterium]|nr:L,D-transpeptidase [Chlorobiota bacterium]